MDCCNEKTQDKKRDQSLEDFKCPQCSNMGVKIDSITPQTLLKISSSEKVKSALHYKFCKNTDCEIAYFTGDETHFFTCDELLVKATLKDSGLDVHICYCFNHTRQSVFNEIVSTGKTLVLEDIKAKMKDPGCFCETSNPQGVCCLGNVTSWVNEAQKLQEKL